MVHEVAFSPSPSVSASNHVQNGLDSDEPDFHTAISYVTRVKARYEHNRRIYERFLHVLRAYRDGHISRSVLCEEVAGMFADQHDLLRDFCIFIPDCEQPAVFATACTAQLTGLRVG